MTALCNTLIISIAMCREKKGCFIYIYIKNCPRQTLVKDIGVLFRYRNAIPLLSPPGGTGRMASNNRCRHVRGAARFKENSFGQPFDVFVIPC